MVSEEVVAAHERYQKRCRRRAISRINRLSQDLVRISKQIGILPEEIPHLVTSIFYLKKMILNSQRCKSVNQLEKIYYPRMFFWDASIASIRTVFVDAYRSRYHRVTWHGRKGNRYQEIKQVRARYSDFRRTLVEELVHYRFPYFREGRELERRIREVLRGKTFPQKHVHLYAFSASKYRKELSKLPIGPNLT